MPLLLGGGATGVGAGAGAGAGGAGAAGAEPVVVVGADVEEDEEVVGVEDDDEPDPELLDEAEDEDPAEVDPDTPAAKAFVVVPTFLVKAFDPPHPMTEKLAMVSAAIVHKPCGFSLIVTFGRSVTGCQVKVGGHLLWIYRARAVADYRIGLKSKGKIQSSTLDVTQHLYSYAARNFCSRFSSG